MNKSHIKITILGAGISGLSAAYWLQRDGWDITVLESDHEPGGSMMTRRGDGFLIDYGPNSGLDTTPLITQMVTELGLGDEMVYANEIGNKRYILKNGRLHALPTTPLAFIQTDLFSLKAKLRLLAEPFIGPSPDGYYQSISQFVERRLGREFLDYAVNPFVAGVFAGNPDELSVKSAFPKLYRLEEVYGGLIKGFIKGAKERKARSETSKQSARIFSFRSGMQVFPKAIAARPGIRLQYDCHVEKVMRHQGRLTVISSRNGKTAEDETDIILSAIPAHSAATVFAEMDPQLSVHLKDIYYPPVKVLYLGYRKAAIRQPLDGFGFLIPEKEKKTFLGAIWSSTLFPDRSRDDLAAFTLFVGGARSPELFENEPELLNKAVMAEFHDIMGIKEDPVFIKEKMWSRAIPQYKIGYVEHERYFRTFEGDNPGIFLSGNYRGGISVGDCIKNSEITYLKVKEYILNLASFRHIEKGIG
ncbi:MAG: protoporphyrinogen oxidase [Desulfobacterales bacterium]|nr:protoporphyrinogen oxidase [Desulfobacterales bacterium]